MALPTDTHLSRYADVLINFGLNEGSGVNPGEVVLLEVPEHARPLLKPLVRHTTRAGAHPLTRIVPGEDVQAAFLEEATREQAAYFHRDYYFGLADAMDHRVRIIGSADPTATQHISQEKVVANDSKLGPYAQYRDEKESRGEFTWTIGMFGTPAMAQEAGMSFDEYWEQIIHACYLDKKDPIAEWRSTQREIHRVRNALNALDIQRLHVNAPDTDLSIEIGERRRWVGCSGHNIPSVEVFTSPDWRGTQGHIRFTEPLYRFGSVAKDISLEFDDGHVVGVDATEGKGLIQNIVQQRGGDKVGEFSLTDKRFSRITRFMAETLFDENRGGEHGNTHLALGRAIRPNTYDGSAAEVSDEEWEELGFNVDADQHNDLISTSERVVRAQLADGTTRVIYRDGKFTL